MVSPHTPCAPVTPAAFPDVCSAPPLRCASVLAAGPGSRPPQLPLCPFGEPHSSYSCPLKGHRLVKPSQTPLPPTTVDRRGCAAHTLVTLLSPHGQPSVHPAQGAGVSEEQTPPGSIPKLQCAGPPPELRVLQGWVRWHQRTPCLRGSPGVRGASAVERQGARSLCYVSKPCGQGRTS